MKRKRLEVVLVGSKNAQERSWALTHWRSWSIGSHCAYTSHPASCERVHGSDHSGAALAVGRWRGAHWKNKISPL
jgi:hypothetical protein